MPGRLPYPKKRYTDEVHRLFGVMNNALATRKFWRRLFHRRHRLLELGAVGSKHAPLDEFPHLKAWRDRVGARPAVQRGKALAGRKLRKTHDATRMRKILFGQRAQDLRTVR
jgi:glutathione S-transferase